MPRIGIIVDGQGDLASLKTRFENGYKILKTDAPRGHCVLPEVIARLSRKQVAILAAFKCTKVVILTDFEARPQNYDAFELAVRQEIATMNFPIEVVAVCPNQMIENWYLADVAHLSTRKAFLKAKPPKKLFEGTHGKNEIKRLMRLGHEYSETSHGPALFRDIRFSQARKRSRSFDSFLSELGVSDV